MNPKFQASVTNREDVTYVKLSGVIDEDNELGTLAEKLGTGTAVIDVSEIERINSCGVRDWVNWLGRAEKQGAKVVLVECSPAIVAQINLVNNFTGQGVVKSFYAPYFCPNCDLEKVLLVETRDLFATQPFKAPSCRCDECDGPMDFDDMEDSYFAFLSNSKKIVTDARLSSVLNEFTPTDGDGRKVRSRTGTNPGAKTGSTGGSLPSIPSLPATRTGASGGGVQASVSGVNGSAGPRLSVPPGANEGGRMSAASGGAEAKSAKSWLVVVGLMVVVIGLLGFFIFK
jgi:anti-anti-sigma regulatory factor